MSGEVKTRTAEAETVVTRKSQVSNNMTAPSEADDSNDTKPMMKASSPGIPTSGNEAQTFPPEDISDNKNSEICLEPANRASGVTSDTRPAPVPRSGEDATEKTEDRNVSCVRDLINSAIEKTLQDSVDQRRSQTPPPTVGGKVLTLMLVLVVHVEGLHGCYA